MSAPESVSTQSALSSTGDTAHSSQPSKSPVETSRRSRSRSDSGSGSNRSLSPNSDDVLITTPVIFQSIHVDVHENQRWFPIIGWATSRLPDDPPNFSLVQLSDAALNLGNSRIAPHVAAFHRVFNQMIQEQHAADRLSAESGTTAAKTTPQRGGAHGHVPQSTPVTPAANAPDLVLIGQGYVESITLPVRPLHLVLPPGYAWEGDWEVARNHPRGTDAMGWRYAPDFYSTRRSSIGEDAAAPDSSGQTTSHGSVHASTGAAKETPSSNSHPPTSVQLSRGHFQVTQSALCVVRYRTWRRRVRVTSALAAASASRTSHVSRSASSAPALRPHDESTRTHEHEHEHEHERVRARDDMPSHPAELHDMPHVVSAAHPDSTDHAVALVKPNDGITGDDATTLPVHHSSDTNTRYLATREDEMMMAQQLKARRWSRLRSGQPWTSQDDLAAEEELRAYARERRAQSGGAAAAGGGVLSPERVVLSCPFGNPFDRLAEPSFSTPVVEVERGAREREDDRARDGRESYSAMNSSPTTRPSLAATNTDTQHIMPFSNSSSHDRQHRMEHSHEGRERIGAVSQGGHSDHASSAEEARLRASFAGGDAASVLTTTATTSLGNRPASGTDGLQTEQRVSRFVPASPNSRRSDESEAVTWSANPAVVVDADNDFDAVFQKFVNNPENSSTTR